MSADSTNGTPSGGRYRLDRRIPEGTSGRKLVLAAVVVLLVLTGGLTLAFRSWRGRYLERAEFAKSEVAATVEPLAALAPPDVEPNAWRREVAATRAMIGAVAASGMLDMNRLSALRDELRSRVAPALTDPKQAPDIVRDLWKTMETRARPFVNGYRERARFGREEVATRLAPLREFVPPGVERDEWRAAVGRTAEMLEVWTASDRLDLRRMRTLRESLTARVGQARARPETAVTMLRGIWDEAESRVQPIRPFEPWPQRPPLVGGPVAASQSPRS